uniref:Uncharacterized protein n=1 Tax=Rhizophora mucronata TaxID=61149 RepID=A0A2P2Q7V3_RHIMU
MGIIRFLSSKKVIYTQPNEMHHVFHNSHQLELYKATDGCSTPYP